MAVDVLEPWVTSSPVAMILAFRVDESFLSTENDYNFLRYPNIEEKYKWMQIYFCNALLIQDVTA